MNKLYDAEDLVVWPDDSWCYLEDLEEYPWKSDDYTVVSVYNPKYDYYLNCNFLYDEVMKGYLERMTKEEVEKLLSTKE